MPLENIRMANPRRFTVGDLKELAGMPDLESPKQWRDSLTYLVLDPDEQSVIESSVREEIMTRAWRVSGDNDSAVWERGWGEVALRVETLDKIDPFALSPNYFRGEKIFRLNGRYVRAVSDDAEFLIGLMIREAILAHWLAPYSEVIEFGCGTGLNLFLLANRFPEKRYLGCDWAKPVGSILDRIARATATPVEFCQYNMLTGSGLNGKEFKPGTAICTVHAMEQLHTMWEPFIKDVMRCRPAVCVHLEPFVELYSTENRFDELASMFHQKRKYLVGFIPALREMHERGEVELLECRRVSFGGKFHEAYSIAVWKPL
jgi:SAM-dependent methyltransferase